MLLTVMIFNLCLPLLVAAGHPHLHYSADHDSYLSHPTNVPHASSDPIPLSVRERWMRRAIDALSDLKSPCPFGAFGTVIVNHTSSIEGDLVCIGANSVREEGNPTLHGEVAGIRNCTAVLISPEGPYKLSPAEALAAFQHLSLYTTAEACPMCASAIRMALFAEYVYATSLPRLVQLSWPQIDIRSHEVFERSARLASQTRIVGGVLSNETDGLFEWQFQDGECPNGSGCVKDGEGRCYRPEPGHDEL